MLTRSPLRFPFLLAVLFPLGACSAPRVEVMPRIQRAELGGSFAGNSSGVTLAKNDVVSDLGLGETSDEFGARADLVVGGSTFTFAYSPASFSGNGTLNGDVSQGGTTIPAGTAVATDLKMDVGSAIWTHDFVPGDAFELGLGLGVHWVDFHSTMTDGTNTETFDQVAPIPVLALRGGAAFGPFDVSALVSGIKAKASGDEFTFLDTDLMGRWHFFGGVAGALSGALILGWHRTDVELDYTDSSDHIDANFNVSGLYYGLSIGF
ncbi:MAG TPA: hypothetical protein VKF60_18390 [Myxococcota bacterium]|nr:hypothetical protein [Myxococcota bacterium]